MSVREAFTVSFGKILHRLVDFAVTEVIQTVNICPYLTPCSYSCFCSPFCQTDSCPLLRKPLEICGELNICSFLLPVGFRLLYCFSVFSDASESSLFKIKFAIVLCLNCILWYRPVTPAGHVSCCVRCCTDVMVDMLPEPRIFHNQWNFSVPTLLT